MGKLKKAQMPEKDEGQKKISNFFQKSSASAKASGLFTQLGQKCSTAGGRSNIFQKAQEVIEIDDDGDKDFKPPKISNKDRQEFAESKLAKALKQSENVRNLFARKKISSEAGSSGVCQDEVTVVPETQLAFTPDGKKPEESVKENFDNLKLDSFQSPGSACSDTPEALMIPDTPDNVHDKTKVKRPLGRSFLLSADHFGSNPIQKAKEHREAKLALKKKASLARKSLVSVSVKFSEDRGPDKTVDSVSVAEKRNDIVMNEESHKPPQDKQPNLAEDTDKAVHENGTPTKIYSDGVSIKRMAKFGSSPDSKRTASAVEMTSADFDNDTNEVVKSLDFTRDGHELNEKASEEINVRQVEEMNQKAAALIENQEKKLKEKKEKLEKERLERMERKKQMIREEKKRNSEKMLKYQLSGSAANTSSKPESLSADDTLDDILQELHSPSLIKGHKTVNKRKEGTNSTKETTRSGVGIKMEEKTVKNKRYSLEGVLVEGNDDPSSKIRTNAKDTATNNDKKPVTVIKDKHSNDVSMDWTDEDEKYFAQLGVKLDQTNSERDSFSSLQNEHASNNREHIETRKLTATETKRTHVGTKDSKLIAVNKKSKVAEKLVPEKKCSREIVDITDYPTQSCQSSEKSIVLHQEIDIDEFSTQTESQIICKELEKLSPFKKSTQERASDLFQSEAPCIEFSRHIVTDVENDRAGQQMTLELISQPGEITRKCILHGFWLDTHVEQGDIVHVLAEFVDGVCNISDKHGFLIVNPDLLISGTTVVSSVFCMRKSILKEKFKGCDSRNIYMLYGSIIHSVFQQVLRKKLLTEESVLREAEVIVKQSANLLEMYANKVTEDKVMEEVKSYLPQILSWTKQYTDIGQDILGNQRSSDSEVMITKVSDIEENIWSPRYGVKGKIDLTVQVKIKNEKKKTLLPLELKTGKPSYSVDHKGQVTLYSMMSSDRREDPGQGLLLYLKEPSMKVIPADHVNKKGLIQLRNEMAYYISRQVVRSADDTGTTYTLGRLPEPISNVRACQKCPQLMNCAIYQRKIEDRPPSGSAVSGLVTETIQHLTADHVTYFIQWCLMLDLEAKVDRSKKTIADIWCLSSGEREDVGMCISGMVLLSDSQIEEAGDDTVILSFSRHPDNHRKKALTSVGLNSQDSVVISCEKPSWIAVCTGFLHKISNTAIQILTDRDVLDRLKLLRGKTFRLDKCDNFSTAGMLYTNLSRLMTAEHRYERLRHLIIDKIKPEFSPTLSKGSLEKVKSIFKSLNKPQKAAVLKVLMCKDYVLIKGYPGTGKTSTIVALVKVLHTLGLSVLLTSYTHSAVDNILLKLKKASVKFLRLGRVAKIHPDIREFSVDRLTQNMNSTAELETFLHSQTIVATSCLGTTHSLFTHRQFDICIVDEASQVLQPACLGPLFTCRRFVLVGDPKQLPPVVQSKEARDLGMDKSLFARLDGQGATFDLNLQYRMNKEIMCISNLLVYKGCLQCGSDEVANNTLQLPAPHHVQSIVESSPWLSDVLSTSLEKSVVFLDTHKVPAPETREKGGVVKNYTEAKLVLQIVSSLIQVGVPADDIGIIAPYRSQVYLLRNLLVEGQCQTSGAEVNTVDQYQGRDKSVIIISFVRSAAEGDTKTGELLKDVRRLNVAVTRAKTKLVLIGNITTLRLYAPLQQVIELCENKQQITYLPFGTVL